MIYVDTNVLVYAIENHPKYGRSCKKILKDIEEKRIEAACSILVLVELLNILTKLNRVLAKQEARKLNIADNVLAVLSLPIVWIDLDFLVIEIASRYGFDLNGVDYIHIASMEANSINEIVSADEDLDKVRSVKRIDPLDFN